VRTLEDLSISVMPAVVRIPRAVVIFGSTAPTINDVLYCLALENRAEYQFKIEYTTTTIYVPPL